MSVPYPSIADIYRPVGYGFLFFAILAYVGLLRIIISRKIVATASIFVFWFFARAILRVSLKISR